MICLKMSADCDMSLNELHHLCITLILMPVVYLHTKSAHRHNFLKITICIPGSLWVFSLFLPLPLFSHAHTNWHSLPLLHTFLHTFLRPGSGGFEVISWLLFYWWFPSNMKRFFSHLTTHTCAASGLSLRTYTDSQKQVVGVSSTRPASHVRSCTELHTRTRTHPHKHTHRHTHTQICTLILDLYGVLHPPLSAAVKVFLNSYKSAIFKEVRARTHKHTLTSHTDF